MRRLWPVVLIGVLGVVAACSGGAAAPRPPNGKEWPIDQIMRTAFGSNAFRECGRLSVQRGSTIELRDARACVDLALGEARPFVVRWFVPGAGNTIANGYIGRYEGSELKLYYLNFNSYPCSGASCSPCNTNVTRCRRLTPNASCDNLDENLCLSCADAVAVDLCPAQTPAE